MHHLSEDQVAEAGRLGRLGRFSGSPLYSITPLQALSVDTRLGPLPEDEYGMHNIILIVDNFSKFVGLYPAKTALTLEFVRALSYLGLEFLVPSIFGGSQFSSEMAERLNILLKYQHHRCLLSFSSKFDGGVSYEGGECAS